MSTTTNTRFYQWIADVCEQLGRPATYGVELLKDSSWFACFDDGMTPQEAADKYLRMNGERN